MLQIGCMELDLVRLYEVVEQHGGLMGVIERELWGKVADACRIPRSAQERLTKLDSIYCKYLLPYATLSKSEYSNESRLIPLGTSVIAIKLVVM